VAPISGTTQVSTPSRSERAMARSSCRCDWPRSSRAAAQLGLRGGDLRRAARLARSSASSSWRSWMSAFFTAVAAASFSCVEASPAANSRLVLLGLEADDVGVELLLRQRRRRVGH